VRIGQALGFDAKDRATLRAFGNSQAFFAVQAGDLQLGAEGSLRNADGDGTVKIGSPAFEEIVFLDVEDDIEIARRAAVWPWLAFACDAEARAGVDAGRNAEINGSLAFDAALAAAIGAALFDNLTGALTGGASAINGEETLLIDNLAAASAGLAGDDAGSFFRAGAIARFAEFLARNADFGSDSSCGFFER
jgi:hypothetical protein